MKRYLIAVIAAIAMGSFSGPGMCASLEDLQVKELAKVSVAQHNAYNGAYLINISYSVVGASTQAAIGVSSYQITSEAPLGTADSNFGSSGAYSLIATSYDTIGELCDAIEALANYTCKIVDGKRDDSSILLKQVTASASTDAKLSGGYSLLISTGGSSMTSDTDPYIDRLGIIPASGKSVVLKYCNVQNDGTGTVKIYGKTMKRAGSTDNDTTLVWNVADVNDTTLRVPASPDLMNLQFAKDAHVVISGGNASTAQTSTSFIECFWDEK